MATKATQQAAAGDTTTEFHVWYDAPDGARRSANALDSAGVQQIMADLHAEEDKRQLAAQSVGLTIPPHDYNVTINEVITTTTEVQP